MAENDWTIRRERADEYAKTEDLVREAFWNVYRPGCLEHYVLHCMRTDADFVSELDLVMEHAGELIGQVMCVRNELRPPAGPAIEVLTLGPICIHPAHQRRGLGKILLDHSLALAAKTGAAGVFLEGNIGFYGKSGFVPASTLGIRYMDEPEDDPVPYFLAKVLTDACFAGKGARYRVPRGYFVDEAEAAEFDRAFPPKERLKLPGQLV